MIDTIQLRSLKRSDLMFLFEIENDKKNAQYSTFNKKYSLETLVNFIENSSASFDECGQERLVISLQKNGKPIGFLDLYDYESTTKKAGVGILISEEFRNKRIGQQSIFFMEAELRKKRKIEILYAEIPSWNNRSIEFFRKVGFTLTSNKKNDTLHKQLIFEKNVGI